MMRVLAVIPGEGKDASFIFARRQVESLAKLGLAVQIFYLKSRVSPGPVLREWLRLRRAIFEFSPDVVHAHYGTITSFLCTLATSRPVAITFRGSDLNPAPEIGFLRRRTGLLLSQISALRASAIVCTGSRLRDSLWWRREVTKVLPSGIDLELFKPMDQERARKELSFNLSERIVLFNASMDSVLKGVVLAEGAVECAESLVGKIQFIQLDGTVPPEKMPVYMNAADCLVLASRSEGSPNVVKEAMACNLPIASVDVGDVAELLQGVSPSQVTSRDPRVLGEAIAGILRLRKRSNGREKIQKYSDEKIALRILEVYESTCLRRH